MPTPTQIKTGRKAAKLTQAEAAALIHASPKSWGKWERGEREMHEAFWELFQIKAKGAKK